MAPPGIALPLVLSLNVNGLRSASKRKALFAQLQQGPWQVVLLQETHSSSDDEAAAWAQEGAGPGMPWLGQAYWSHGTAGSGGVAVLVAAQWAADMAAWAISTPYAGAGGRLLRVEWQPPAAHPHLSPLAVVSVYAPVQQAERRQFLAGDGPLAAALSAGSGAQAVVLAGGDYNCVPSLADVFGAHGPGGGGRMVGSQNLLSLMASHGMVDAWRHLNPSGADPTHVAMHTGGASSAGRIDQIWVSSSTVQQGWLQACQHIHGQFHADHAALELRMRDPSLPREGPGLWRFPLPALQDVAFCTVMRADLQTLQQSWQPHTPAAQLAPARHKWEAAKQLIKQRGIAYQQQQRTAKRQQAVLARAQFEAPLRAMATSPSVAPQAGIAYRHSLSSACARYRDRAAQQHTAAGALWRRYGEQGTKWFHRLGRVPYSKVPIVALKLPGGQRVSLEHDGKPAMDAAITSHFVGPSGVFAAPHTSPQDVAAMLSTITRTVPPALAAQSPGGGQLDEGSLAKALSGCPPGKAPGSDGLPYEVYHAFSDLLLPLLSAAANETFAAAGQGDTAPLPHSMRVGIVTLLHKGGDKSVDELSSFRPITLLNCDYKLIARVLVQWLSPLVDAVTDHTQTAFVPGRWIGDNVLMHLEEIDYCTSTSTAGCILFLDFSQAYDRLCRDWLYACMQHMQFPQWAVQWVQLMLAGTAIRVRYHGWHTPAMQIGTGLAQGSPLSPLLWVIAAQPLSSGMQQLQDSDAIDAIQLPGGGKAPPTHQHADDTSLHVATRASAAVALDQCIQPFCRASNSRLNVDKSRGLELGQAQPFSGVDPHTGVKFLGPADDPHKHLGVLLAHDQGRAASAMYAARLRGLHASIRHWGKHALTYVGRLHVAKAVLASTVYYHATFVQPPPDALQRIEAAINHYIAGAALSEDVGRLQGKPPGKLIEALPKLEGGLGRVCVRTQITALQAKVATMLLHPRRHPWKVLMSAAFQRALPGLGSAALVSRCKPHQGAGGALGLRRLAYWQAFSALQSYRCVPPGRLTTGHVGAERLLHNARIAPPGASKLAALPAGLPPGCTTVGDLKQYITSEDEHVASAARQVLAYLPDAWQEHALPGPPRCPQWQVSACGLWVRKPRTQQSTLVWRVLPDGRLADAAHAPPPSLAWRAAAVTFAPCAKGVRPSATEVPPGGHLQGLFDISSLQAYLLGAWQDAPVDPLIWAVGPRRPVAAYVVKEGRARLLHAAVQRQHPAYRPGGGVAPRLWGRGAAAALPPQLLPQQLPPPPLPPLPPAPPRPVLP